MDFMLIQSYLDKIPSIDGLFDIPEIAEIGKKFSKIKVEEKLSEILDKRHLIITTAKDEADVNKMDFSIDFYINYLKEVLEEEVEAGSKKLINAMGTIYSKYIGNKFYPKELLKEFTENFTEYNTLNYNTKTNKGISLDREIEDMFRSYNNDKGYILLSSVTGALYTLLKVIYNENNIVCSLKESYTFDDGSDIIKTIKEAGAAPSIVGSMNSLTKDDYIEAIDDESVILNTDILSNRLEGLASLSQDEIAELTKDYPGIHITDRVYIKSQVEELNRFAVSLQKILKGEGTYIIDLSKTENLPAGALVAGNREDIELIKKSVYAKLFALSGEVKTLYYLGLKKKLEEGEESFLASTLSKDNSQVKEANSRLLELLQEELVDIVDFGLIEGPYLKVEEGVSYSEAFNRELLVITPKDKDVSEIEEKLRLGDPAVLCWLNEGSLIFNLQLIDQKDEEILANKIIEAIKG